MRILGYVHTYNSGRTIDGVVESLCSQTYPLQEIIIVDNASTDNTLNRPFPRKVTVIRHPKNLGCSGAVNTGCQYAIDNYYDWIWVLDADGVIKEDALEKLMELYNHFCVEEQERVFFLACLPLAKLDLKPLHGGIITSRGVKRALPDPGRSFYRCHFTIWSGTLFSIRAVRTIGHAPPDYFMDWGDLAYGYRAMKAGFHSYMHTESILYHDMGNPSLFPTLHRRGLFSFTTYEFPPARCYYMVRNMLYFSLYELDENRLLTFAGVLVKIFKLTINFLWRPRGHRSQIRACFLGILDGLTGNIKQRFK